MFLRFTLTYPMYGSGDYGPKTGPRARAFYEKYKREHPLHAAVMANDKAEVMRLLPDARINLQDYHKRTALHIAVRKGNAELVRLLLTHPEINLDLQDRRGRIPLDLLRLPGRTFFDPMIEYFLSSAAQRHSQRDMLAMQQQERLIERAGLLKALGNQGVGDATIDVNTVTRMIAKAADDINLQDIDSGMTALHIVVKRASRRMGGMFWMYPSISQAEYVDVMKALLRHDNIDVNLQDSRGRTALHYAVEENNLKLVRFLLVSPGIDVTLLDDKGMTPLDLAEHHISEYGEHKIDHRIISALRAAVIQQEKGSLDASADLTSEARAHRSAAPPRTISVSLAGVPTRDDESGVDMPSSSRGQ